MMKINSALKIASIILAVIGFTRNLQAIPTTTSVGILSALSGDYVLTSDDAVTKKPFILFSPTVGTSINRQWMFTFSAPSSGVATIVFSATTIALALPQVPDGGNTVIMVGMSLLGLGFVGFIYRK